ncbi:hypothetical protein GBAR_LOCUS28668, partial [Geodia barretti]
MMVVSRPGLILLSTALCALLAPSLCAQKIPPCESDIWGIAYEANAEEGHAELVIIVPGASDEIESVSSILTCTDLEVNGTGKSVVQVDEGENTTVFQISVPEPKDVKEFEEQGGWMTHHCVLQLSYLSATEPDVSAHETECEVKLLTVFGRILPRCSLER